MDRVKRSKQSAIIIVLCGCLAAACYWALRNGFERSASGPEDTTEPSGKLVTGTSVVAGESTHLSRLQTLSSSDPGDQVEIEKQISEMTEAEVIAALEAIWTDDVTAPRNELAIQLLRRWAEQSPAAAATWISSRPETVSQVEGLRAVVAAWAASDLKGAAQWVRQLAGEQRISAIIAAGYEAAQNSPREALWLAAELPSSALRDDLIHNVVGQWVHNDTNAPLAWARQMPKSSLREQVFGSIAVSMSDSMPAMAASLAIDELPAGKQQNDAVISIVQRWAQQNGLEAAEWVQSFPEGPLREQAVENLVQLWADKSPEQAAAWVEQLGEGPFRDAALGALSQGAALTF